MEVEVSILSFVPPGAGEIPIGILVFDQHLNQLWARFRQDWDQVDTEEAALLAALAEDLIRVGRELGAQSLLEYLEDVCSHSIRISSRNQIQTDDLEMLLDSLYANHIERTE